MVIEQIDKRSDTGEHPNLSRMQDLWDAVVRDDFPTALQGLADDITIENGPGAGPWRHVDGMDAVLTFLAQFVPFFEGTWHQEGRCIYADDRFAISLVHETGTAPTGTQFDNQAVYVCRFDPDGMINRIWTTDIDHESMDGFWRSHPIEPQS